MKKHENLAWKWQSYITVWLWSVCLCVLQSEADCVRCKHVKDGAYCMSECPSSKYADHSGFCHDCHEYCGSFGCTGPLNGACNACSIAEYNTERVITACLPPESTESDCEPGYFKHKSLPADYGPMAGQMVSDYYYYYYYYFDYYYYSAPLKLRPYGAIEIQLLLLLISPPPSRGH